MQILFERIGVLATLVMFFLSGVSKVYNHEQQVKDIERLIKVTSLPEYAAFASIFLAGVFEFAAVVVIVLDLFNDGQLNSKVSIYAYSFLIIFTIIVTFLFYANPFKNIFNHVAFLSNLTTLGALLVGLSITLKNSPAFLPIKL